MLAGRTAALLRLDHAPKTPEELAAPLVIWSEKQIDPPLAAYIVRVDLRAPMLEVIAMPAEDPDGAGPAEAALTDPRSLAKQFHALVAVNANAFKDVPKLGEKPDTHWHAGQPVDIIGLAVSAGKVRSGAETTPGNNMCFWMDADRGAHISPAPAELAGVREAVNIWWIDLLKDGHVLPEAGGDRHPRTAVGLDAGARTLYLAVVDGRQPGYSQGMTAAELAALMLHLGCDRAINLDGGGSSILLAAEKDALTPVNRPSDGRPRPVPLLLGVRARMPEVCEKAPGSTKPAP